MESPPPPSFPSQNPDHKLYPTCLSTMSTCDLSSPGKQPVVGCIRAMNAIEFLHRVGGDAPLNQLRAAVQYHITDYTALEFVRRCVVGVLTGGSGGVYSNSGGAGGPDRGNLSSAFDGVPSYIMDGWIPESPVTGPSAPQSPRGGPLGASRSPQTSPLSTYSESQTAGRGMDDGFSLLPAPALAVRSGGSAASAISGEPGGAGAGAGGGAGGGGTSASVAAAAVAAAASGVVEPELWTAFLAQHAEAKAAAMKVSRTASVRKGGGGFDSDDDGSDGSDDMAHTPQGRGKRCWPPCGLACVYVCNACTCVFVGNVWCSLRFYSLIGLGRVPGCAFGCRCRCQLSSRWSI